MSILSNSLVSSSNPPTQLFSGSHLRPACQSFGSASCTNLAFNSNNLRKLRLSTSSRPLTVQASYSDGRRSGSSSAFVGGFVLGGLVVGALGCVFAPQISKALAVADRKDLMKRLPKFIYDEEKALEKTRKVLTEKIAQLNAAIDDVSGQLRSEDAPNGVAVNSDEIEAAI
ncbi:Carboxyltransferase Interactor1 [Hibiscus trionum]|uniref:Carboxyltransferase Interactor1 n=4 Tax=Malvoideae TaxID=214907 RepID=A0A9W7IUE4_HIBTR|nr:Carboxyltransferase Interactor1 [Hibiscus trionum]